METGSMRRAAVPTAALIPPCQRMMAARINALRTPWTAGGRPVIQKRTWSAGLQGIQDRIRQRALLPGRIPGGQARVAVQAVPEAAHHLKRFVQVRRSHPDHRPALQSAAVRPVPGVLLPAGHPVLRAARPSAVDLRVREEAAVLSAHRVPGVPPPAGHPVLQAARPSAVDLRAPEEAVVQYARRVPEILLPEVLPAHPEAAGVDKIRISMRRPL
jgi:hypothetical protein